MSEMYKALDSLPGTSTCNWMSIAEEVSTRLTKPELLELVLYALLSGKQKEHDMFYSALQAAVGDQRAAHLIKQSRCLRKK